ncbi:unnamed protein product [Mytilus edulis]|uniref:Uncharacterized protein n=1 Tax=Mytilus edulis TaxID=6550 RepID=A0A8S3RXC0_MYTED|nr:unnamed protein product [Mytilus edulis]
MKVPTGRSKVVQETIISTPDWKETTFSVVEIRSQKIYRVKMVFQKEKYPSSISNESLAMVGKEVMYAQVNKPTVKREKSTSSQKSQPAASDDTYDHMDHRRLSQTHNPTESNYDTMRSIANAGEKENNYDHVTGTKMDLQRFVVDGASNYSHVEVECHEVKDK